MMDLGLLMVRVALGLVMAAHGAQKLFGWFGGPGISGFAGWLRSLGIRPARAWAATAGIAEFAGGLLLALGLATPLAALAILASMLTAIVAVHLPKGFFASNGGIEYPSVLGAAAFGLALTGPGVISLDVLWLRVAGYPPLVVVGALAVSLLGVVAALESRHLPLPAARSHPSTT